MQHLKSKPDDWNCLIGSLAILLERPYEDVEKYLPGWKTKVFGDGQIEGVHIEQLVYIAHTFDMLLVPFNPVIYYNPTKNPTDLHIMRMKKYESMLSQYDGLLLGRYIRRSYDDKPPHHAVVWNYKEEAIYDPAGIISKRAYFDVDCFYAGIKK